MTRRETFADPDISEKDFVLATDLDGTFLGGSEQERSGLYDWIEANRARVGLIFVTGRDPGFIHDLTKNRGVPRPDYVIGDVGTTIAEMSHNYIVSPIEALEHEIAEAWGNTGPRVQAMLTGAPGLTLQSTQFRYRLSYDMDPALFDPTIVETVEGLGLDTIVSDNKFFDVLPAGVSKGPSLLRLLAHLNVERHRVLVAGDTMNDLSMLQLGLPAVAVGGSEASLTEAVASLDHVFSAEAVGAAGIVDAIRHHKLFPAA
ncbi:HAD-superfamily hydrolase, subfamily IIB [Jannaschia faecimaris]|uniref:HAD-superfamily hydrolase, subfamily IIB n=1 Tax=Jannaschia faecimaris TaxID=1244108 RepID=A0A1H3STR2_9RHOB|nr:HAD-IIB family hydrolase [Jannaschia faecimaris]SDZ40931.1 HAD-superfamily hydrolase, subfamily IIB [Jannaschia faecimaris]